MECNCYECFYNEWNSIGEFFCKKHSKLFEEVLKKMKEEKEKQSNQND